MINRKGQVGGIVAVLSSVLGIAFVLMILGIFMSYQAKIVGDVQDDFTTDSLAYNISQSNLEATSDLSDNQGTLISISIAVIIISLLLIAAAVVGIRFA